jgi:dynein heavy chain, axonemal
VNIFLSGDIRKQLSVEASKFDTVDKFFRSFMVKVSKQPQVMRTLKVNNNLNENLENYNMILDDIQKQLERYLETKRQAFPRFYFLSNDELLEILANSNELDIIQQHLRTCFDNILRLDIKDGQDITHMNSQEGEKV